MLSFEKILNVFASYLKKDNVVEVVMTQHGYTVMLWDHKQQNWWQAEFCATPEKMLELLLDSYGMYLEERLCSAKRDLTEAERSEIEAAQREMKARCERE